METHRGAEGILSKPIHPMGKLSKEELLQRMGSLSKEEMEVLATVIPSELIWNEIKRRFENQQKFINEVKGSMNAMECK